MAFQQLYYTSCETGLAGYGGYQFNAVTPGTSPVVMREVEDRSVYEPPRWLLADPCLDEPEAYPIAFSYAKSEATGAVILTHVEFAGNDYSGRPGNYFAHALVTSYARAGLRPAAARRTLGRRAVAGRPDRSPTNCRSCQGRYRAGSLTAPVCRRFLDAAVPSECSRNCSPRSGGPWPATGWCCWRATTRTRTSGGSLPSPTCSASSSRARTDLYHLQSPARLLPAPLIGIQAERGAARRRFRLSAVRPRRGEDTRWRRASPSHPTRGHGGNGQRGTLAAGDGVRVRNGGRGPTTGSGRWPPRPACSADSCRPARPTRSHAGYPGPRPGYPPSTQASSSVCALEPDSRRLADKQVRSLLDVARSSTPVSGRAAGTPPRRAAITRIGRGEPAGTPPFGPVGAQAPRLR